jgi:hypothetical protein
MMMMITWHVNVYGRLSQVDERQGRGKERILKGEENRNEMFSFSGKRMQVENTILSEVSLAQKTKTRMFSLICGH